MYNGSVHYRHISQALQREGRRCHLLASAQTVVDAVRKLSDKQGWLSCLLLQLALAQLEVGHLAPMLCLTYQRPLQSDCMNASMRYMVDKLFTKA